MEEYLNHCNYTTRELHGLFGISKESILLIWATLQQDKDISTIKPKHLLWTLCFFKNYFICEVAAQLWNCDVKTYRFYVWKVIFMLFEHLDTVSYIN